MSTSIYQSGASQQAGSSSLAQMQQNYKNLFTALKTGNLALAQTAVKSLNFSSNTLKGNAMLSSIVTAIQNGDLVSAQKALTGTNSNGGLLAAIDAEENNDSSSSDTSNPGIQILQSTSSSATNSSPITTLSAGLGNTSSAAAMKGVGTLFDQMA